jgi:iron complex outermembrane receptor protein
MMRVDYGVSALALAAALGLSASRAQAAGAPPTSVSEVVVTGEHVRKLEQFTPTSSRLGLSTRETPATLDIIDAASITTRGLPTVEQAAVTLPGVTSGGSPGDPAEFAMRGFSGDQISILHNGLYIGPANMTNRPQNTFNLQSIEILKGPASVLYGQGAIGGTVNVTNKAPSFGAAQYEALVAIGSFGSTSLGFGGGGGLRENLGARFDISRTSTDGFVDRAHASALNVTLSLLWRPSDNLDVQFSIDYGEDRPSPYWGTPLVPTSFATSPLNGVLSTSPGFTINGVATSYTIDSRMRHVNFNVADYKIYDHQTWPQLYVKWQPLDGVTVQDFLYYFNAKRRWMNAETYTFIQGPTPTTGLIDRDRFFVFHEQDMWGDQASVSIKRDVFGLANKFVVGLDYSHLDFKRTRGFPDNDRVDPFHPSPGLFGVDAKRYSPTKWDDLALFAEDALDITSDLKLVVGGRLERLKLDRKNFGPTGAFQAGSSFERTYKPSTWRVGLVYNLNAYVTPYVSYTTGEDPVGTNIFIVNAGQNFSLSSSKQAEAGVKASLPDNRGSLTVALYDIERRNILTQVSVGGDLTNIGSQKSKGLEVSGTLRPIDNWAIDANVAYTDAKYGTFVDPNFNIDATGNRPPDIPKWVANGWTSLSHVGGLPLTLGGGVRYVGERFGNSANTLNLKPYTLVNLYATYELMPNVAVSARVDNVFDKAYAQWADMFYPTEVMLGRPRYYEVSVSTKF